jgi:hypothetical protein
MPDDLTLIFHIRVLTFAVEICLILIGRWAFHHGIDRLPENVINELIVRKVQFAELTGIRCGLLLTICLTQAQNATEQE